VPLDALDRHGQVLGDLPVGEAARRQLGDPALAAGEQRDRLLVQRPGLLTGALEQPRDATVQRPEGLLDGVVLGRTKQPDGAVGLAAGEQHQHPGQVGVDLGGEAAVAGSAREAAGAVEQGQRVGGGVDRRDGPQRDRQVPRLGRLVGEGEQPAREPGGLRAQAEPHHGQRRARPPRHERGAVGVGHLAGPAEVQERALVVTGRGGELGVRQAGQDAGRPRVAQRRLERGGGDRCGRHVPGSEPTGQQQRGVRGPLVGGGQPAGRDRELARGATDVAGPDQLPALDERPRAR